MLTNPEILEIMRIRLLRLTFSSRLPFSVEPEVTDAGRPSQCRTRDRERYRGARRLTVMTEFRSSNIVSLHITYVLESGKGDIPSVQSIWSFHIETPV
jgi:hypothetical protein